MKRFSRFTILAAAILLFAGCSKSSDGGNLPIVDFSTSESTIYMGGEVNIPIVLSEPAEKPGTVNLKFEGSAVKGTDYTVSAESVSFAAGSMVGSIVIKDINLTTGKEIKVLIDSVGKLKKGNRSSMRITCPGELLTYTFGDRTEGNIIERYYIQIKLSGSKSGDSWRASSEMHIPALLKGEAAAQLFFSDEKGQIDTRGFVVKQGSNTGEVCVGVGSATEITSIKKAVVEPDYVSYNGVVPGEKPSFTLSVQGHYRLTGTWRFERFAYEDALKAAFTANGDDISLLPLNNNNFYFKVDTETRDDTVYTVLTPSITGDFAAFFTKADITGCTPVNVREGGRLAGNCTAIEDGVSHLFMKLSNSNRSFNKDNMIYGEACISIHILDNGKMELTLRDYNKPPFGTNSWQDGSFDPDLFGLTSIFTYER